MSDPPPTQPTTVVNVHLDNTNYASAVAEASAVAVAGEAGGARKSTFVAYVAFTLGFWGAIHRVYLRRPFGKWLFLLYFFLPLTAISIGFGEGVFLMYLSLLVIDAFLIPGWVRRHNAGRRTATPPPVSLSAPAGAAGALAVGPSQPSPVQSHQREKPQDLKTRLLRIAHRGDGKLTVTQAVMETGESFEKVERHLRQMVRDGHIDVDNEPDSGVVVYLFPELVGRPRLGHPASDA